MLWHLYKDRMNIHNVYFTSPDLHSPNMVYDNINDNLDIYDEADTDVVFPTLLAKYFGENIVELMENLQSSKRKGDNEYDYDEELELNSDTDNHGTEEEQHLASINDQIPVNCETDANSCKTFLGHLTETQQDHLVTSIHDKELMILEKGKLKETGNLAPKSSTIASTSTNRGTQLGDKNTSGEQINGPSDIQVSDNIAVTKSKQKSRNQAELNAEATFQFNKNQTETPVTLFPESRDNGQQSVLSAETCTNIVESTIYEDTMEAFYSSLEAETTSLSHLQDTKANTVSVRTRPSEETRKALQILRDFVSKKFSLLLHPGRSGLMRDILKYLLSLPPDEGVSLRTKSLVLQLSGSFSQWSLDYNNASLKLESAAADLSKVEKVKEDLEANVKYFREVEMLEKCLCSQLACLQERKRELEEQINVIKAEIVDFTAEKYMVA